MIHILSGPVNSLKTTRLKSLYRGKGEGVISLKRMEGKTVDSYLAQQLSTGIQKILFIREDRVPINYECGDKIGPYVMNSATLEWIEGFIRKELKNDRPIIFIDEIGKLELEGRGYHRIFLEVSAKARDLYFTCQTRYREQIISKYQLKSIAFL